MRQYDKTLKAIEGLVNHGQSMENRLPSYASHTQSAIEGLTNHGHLLDIRLDRLGTIVANQSNSIQCLGNTLESHDRKLNNLEDRVKQLEIKMGIRVANQLDRLGTIAANQSNSIQCHERPRQGL